MNDDLGNRMKAYERVNQTMLMPHGYHILRVDGRAFHTYLRNAAKPFDEKFIMDMALVGQALLSEVSGSVFAYGQSDEISVVFQDLERQAQPWFGGRIQKIVSVAASVATVALATVRDPSGNAQFDARVFTLPNLTEVANYFLWRQRDAVRNSVSMAAQAKFSHSQLHGKGSGEMQEMLFMEHGINWNDYPDVCKRGWVAYRITRNEPVTFTHKRTQEIVTVNAMRTIQRMRGAPHFSAVLLEGWLTGDIDIEPAEVPDVELESVAP
jgi:tRNA(His) guanylyltransferase